MLVIYQPQSRGAVTQFLKLLIDGIPESKYFQRGLKTLFRLNSVEPVLKELKKPIAEGYEETIDEALRDVDSRGFDIALVECPEGSRDIPIKPNPYYRARARLMSCGIPTQGVRDEHLQHYGLPCKIRLDQWRFRFMPERRPGDSRLESATRWKDQIFGLALNRVGLLESPHSFSVTGVMCWGNA